MHIEYRMAERSWLFDPELFSICLNHCKVAMEKKSFGFGVKEND